MAEKRYAIVRVDEGCPLESLQLNTNFFCVASKSCQKCLYGDTKEQMVRKVAQVIKRKLNEGFIMRYREPSISIEKLAKEIVEFLGVE